MKPARRLSYAGFVWTYCLIAVSACRSASTPSAGEIEPAREFTMVGIESQLFAAVVRAQLAGGDGDADYPHRLDRFQYDPRPYGTKTGYPEIFAGVQGADPTLSFARASESEIERVIENRKATLQENGVRQGPVANYPQCAGVSVPTPPPPRGRARRSRTPDVHDGCPKTPEYYLTVGLPIRGQPPGLENRRDTRGDKVRLDGEVWSVLVEETSVGPVGWRKRVYGWLFKRNDFGNLELANTILVDVIE